MDKINEELNLLSIRYHTNIIAVFSIINASAFYTERGYTFINSDVNDKCLKIRNSFSFIPGDGNTLYPIIRNIDNIVDCKSICKLIKDNAKIDEILNNAFNEMIKYQSSIKYMGENYHRCVD